MSQVNNFIVERRILKQYFRNKELDMTIWRKSFTEKRDKIVVHIPARSGSTRIENKNITDVCGHPLLAYTIRIAQALPVDRVIVNTDSKAIAKVAKDYGAEVPFIRPKELSNDTISPYYSSFFAQRWLVDEHYPVNLFIDMFPTNPFRNVSQTTKFIERALDGGLLYTRAQINGTAKNLFTKEESLEDTLSSQAVIGQSLFKVLSSFMAVKMCADEIKWHEYANIENPIELIDIDTPEDLALAKFIIHNKIYNFGIKI